jgi:hypothetical protein
MNMTKPAKLPKWADNLIEGLEGSGKLAVMNEYGCKVIIADKPKKKQRNTRKEHGSSSYKWYSSLKKQMNTSRPTQWFEEAEVNGLLHGNGERAKRLKQLAKKDSKKLKKFTEKRKEVRDQLGKDLWKYGMVGLSQAGKPRGVKKAPSDTIL